MKRIAFILLILNVFNDVDASEKMDSPVLVIERIQYKESCILGKLYIDDEFICYTGELPEIFNLNNISAIPKGEYLESYIRIDIGKGFRIELGHTAHRKNIQIHSGNYINKINPKTGKYDTTGCILPGMTLNEEACQPLNSVDAMEKIQTILFIDTLIKKTSTYLTVIIRDSYSCKY